MTSVNGTRNEIALRRFAALRFNQNGYGSLPTASMTNCDYYQLRLLPTVGVPTKTITTTTTTTTATATSTTTTNYYNYHDDDANT